MAAHYPSPSPEWYEPPDEIEEETMSSDQTVATALTEMVRELSYLDAQEVADTFEADVAAFCDASVSTYQEAGVLTRDAGFVVRLADGAEYQVTVIRSR